MKMKIKKLNRNDFNDVVYALRVNQRHGKDALLRMSVLSFNSFENWSNGNDIIKDIGHNELVKLILTIKDKFYVDKSCKYDDMILMAIAGKKIKDIADYYSVDRKTVTRNFNNFKDFLFVELNRSIDQWMQTNYCNKQSN